MATSFCDVHAYASGNVIFAFYDDQRRHIKNQVRRAKVYPTYHGQLVHRVVLGLYASSSPKHFCLTLNGIMLDTPCTEQQSIKQLYFHPRWLEASHLADIVQLEIVPCINIHDLHHAIVVSLNEINQLIGMTESDMALEFIRCVLHHITDAGMLTLDLGTTCLGCKPKIVLTAAGAGLI
jgi:hypothetical protein